MSNITYYGDGKGNWSKRVWADKCSENIWFTGECQGVEGHEGDHWCYSKDGSYNYGVRGDLEAHDIAGGSTPPGHKDWISPVDMADKYYMRFHEDTEVTDPELIARLNRGEIEDGESLDQPLNFDDLEEELKCRLDAYDENKEEK